MLRVLCLVLLVQRVIGCFCRLDDTECRFSASCKSACTCKDFNNDEDIFSMTVKEKEIQLQLPDTLNGYKGKNASVLVNCTAVPTCCNVLIPSSLEIKCDVVVSPYDEVKILVHRDLPLKPALLINKIPPKEESSLKYKFCDKNWDSCCWEYYNSYTEIKLRNNGTCKGIPTSLDDIKISYCQFQYPKEIKKQIHTLFRRDNGIASYQNTFTYYANKSVSDVHQYNTPCHQREEKLLYLDVEPNRDKVWCWTPSTHSIQAAVVHCKIQETQVVTENLALIVVVPLVSVFVVLLLLCIAGRYVKRQPLFQKLKKEHPITETIAKSYESKWLPTTDEDGRVDTFQTISENNEDHFEKHAVLLQQKEKSTSNREAEKRKYDEVKEMESLNRTRIDSGYCGGYSSASYPDLCKSAASTDTGCAFTYYPKQNQDSRSLINIPQNDTGFQYVEKPPLTQQYLPKSHPDKISVNANVKKDINEINPGYYVKKVY